MVVLVCNTYCDTVCPLKIICVILCSFGCTGRYNLCKLCIRQYFQCGFFRAYNLFYKRKTIYNYTDKYLPKIQHGRFMRAQDTLTCHPCRKIQHGRFMRAQDTLTCHPCRHKRTCPLLPMETPLERILQN